MSIQGLMDSISDKKNPNQYLVDLSDHISNSKGFLEYPFDSFKKIIEECGSAFPNHPEFDNLIDCIALISEKRNSELAAGETFLRRGGQKLVAKYYKESIVYFGKAVLKLAKEESQNGLYLSLVGLAQAYSGIGLLWASNNCLISASWISFKSWYETGVKNKRACDCAKQLAINELFIGRVPSFLSWYELFKLLSRQIDIEQNDEEIPPDELMDACFANRLLNTNNKENVLAVIPDLLETQELWLSQNSSLYKLGYTDLILDDCKRVNINDEKSLDTHFEMVANQPFRNQMIYETNFMSENEISLYSTILGCKFILRFEKDIELLLAAETLLAFFESFLATSLTNVYPSTESIVIDIVKKTNEQRIKFRNKDASSEYIFEINKFDFPIELRKEISNSLLEFTIHILANNFFINNLKEHFQNLFKKEELHERLSLIFEHRNFTQKILGDKPKMFLEDWIKEKVFKEYPMKREKPISFEYEVKKKSLSNDDIYNPENVRHDKRKVFSIIDDNLWNQAEWKGFGFFVDNLGLGIFIVYENIVAGKKIFDNWIKRFGKEDKDELITITIIKGVDKNNPFWYRIRISSYFDIGSCKSDSLLLSTSRINRINANSSQNLDNLINEYCVLKQFRLCPAKIMDDGKDIEPYLDSSILKRKLNIRNAWKIGENDLDRVVFEKGDSPLIPNDVVDAPVLKVLKKMNEQQ